MNLPTPHLYSSSILSRYQASSVAGEYTTVGYLVAIISILALAILPRAKFLQNLLLSLLFTCLGSAMTMFGIWTAIKARERSTPANASPQQRSGYNSSANAVCALWLIFNTW